MTRPTPTVVPSSHTRRRLATVIGTAAACLLTVTACDGSEATPPLPPSATPSATTPTNTATPSTTPLQPPRVPAAGFNVSSAEAFARFYIAAADYAALTGDSTLIRRWANRTCKVCEALATGYERQYRAGGSIKGDVQVRVERIDRARLVRNDAAEVLLNGRVGRFVDLDSATAKPSVYPGGRVSYRLALIWSSSQWRMYAMGISE